MSDGKRLLRLARRNPESEREAARLSLIALSSAGRRPREWPRDLVTTALGSTDGSLGEYSGKMLAYYHAIDLGDAAGAAVHLERALALLPVVPKAFRPALHLEAAFFCALVEKSAERARAHLAQVPAGALNVPDYDRARAAAALARLAGQPAEARALCLLARSPPGACCQRTHRPPVGLTRDSWLDRVITALAAPSSQIVTTPLVGSPAAWLSLDNFSCTKR